MIRLAGLIDLKGLREQEEPEQTPAEQPEGEPTDQNLMVKKLTKLQSMDLSTEQKKKVEEMLAKLQELTGDQEKLDVDGDGEIEASDLQKLRGDDKTDEEIVLENDEDIDEEFKSRDMPNGTSWKLPGGTGWAAKNRAGKTNYWYGKDSNANKASADKWRMSENVDAVEGFIHEDAPVGWEKTVLDMKKHKEIDNPWALAHWMKKKGYQPTNEISSKTTSSYIKQAKADARDWADDVEDPSTSQKHKDYAMKKIQKRGKGIRNAQNKHRKPGETWKTVGGKTAKKNSDGTITYTDK